MKNILGIVLICCCTGLLNGEEHKSPRLAGWSVSAPTLNEAQLGKLEATIKDLNDIFPPKAMSILRQRISIQVDGTEQRPKSGVIKTGYYDGESTVHLVSSRDCGNKILLVHELSHASQKLAIGLDNPRVKSVYQEALDKQLYQKASYLMTNHKEFFAEMSVIYLLRHPTCFPHDRETLKKHDPTSYKLMEEFWGKLDDQTKSTSDNGNSANHPRNANQEPVTGAKLPSKERTENAGAASSAKSSPKAQVVPGVSSPIDAKDKQMIRSLKERLAGTKWVNTNKATFEWDEQGKFMHKGKPRQFEVDGNTVLIDFGTHRDKLVFNDDMSRFEQFSPTAPEKRPLFTGRRTN